MVAVASPKAFVKEAFNKFCAHATLDFKAKNESEGVADKCIRWFWNLLTEQEKKELSVARIAAMANKDYKEFNTITGRIKERLSNL